MDVPFGCTISKTASTWFCRVVSAIAWPGVGLGVKFNCMARIVQVPLTGRPLIETISAMLMKVANVRGATGVVLLGFVANLDTSGVSPHETTRFSILMSRMTPGGAFWLQARPPAIAQV